jgi:hypothetical protein
MGSSRIADLVPTSMLGIIAYAPRIAFTSQAGAPHRSFRPLCDETTPSAQEAHGVLPCSGEHARDGVTCRGRGLVDARIPGVRIGPDSSQSRNVRTTQFVDVEPTGNRTTSTALRNRALRVKRGPTTNPFALAYISKRCFVR